MEKEPTALEMFIQTLLNGIMGSLIIILIASGLCLIFGIMHIVNFAHGEFFMLGGFGAWLFFDQNLLSLPLPPTLRYIVAIVLSMVLVGTLGVVVERFIFRRFRDNLPRVIISSFGIMLILQAAALAGFGTTDKAFGSPFSGQINLGMVAISMERLAAIICGAIFIAGMYLFILRSKFGKAMRAVSQDPEAAAAQGINISYIFSLAMGVGCALAAAGGALVGPIYYVNPYMGVTPVMKAFVVIILGGLGSLPGAILGGFIIGMTESLVTTYAGAHLAMLTIFLILIGFLLVKPTGIFGHEA
jgi:branched-chain amino acid transport system permease protein